MLLLEACLFTGDIAEVTNETASWGNDDDLKLFQSSESFFDCANEGASVKFVDTVGDSAYSYYENKVENGCQIAFVSTTFQRYNGIARARVNSMEGKTGDEATESLSLKTARCNDERLKSEVKWMSISSFCC
jgi:hypothetical protein